MKLFFLIVVVLFANCVHAAQFEDILVYFPMEKGSIKTFALNKDTPDEVVTITDCNSDSNEGCLHEHILYGSMKLYDSFQYVGNSVVRTTMSNMLTGEFKKLVPPQIQLKSPVTIGTSWTNKDGAQTEKSKISAKLQNYSTKSGNYSDVIVVETKVFENKKIKWIQYDYFAPNIGLVKAEALRDKNRYTTKELLEYKSAK
jgi:hypothetical protein